MPRHETQPTGSSTLTNNKLGCPIFGAFLRLRVGIRAQHEPYSDGLPPKLEQGTTAPLPKPAHKPAPSENP
jgi:hypothetical protein